MDACSVEVFRDYSLWAGILRADSFPRRGRGWGDEMNTQATKLEAVENDLKELMADVTRAIEKAQQAVSKIAPKTAAAATETQATPR